MVDVNIIANWFSTIQYFIYTEFKQCNNWLAKALHFHVATMILCCLWQTNNVDKPETQTQNDYAFLLIICICFIISEENMFKCTLTDLCLTFNGKGLQIQMPLIIYNYVRSF